MQCTGERSVFFLLGKIHSAWSALYSTTDSSRITHLITTIKIYDTLLRSQSIKDKVYDIPHDDTGLTGALSVISRSLGLSKEREEKDDNLQINVVDKDNIKFTELSLRYAVCLANLGETAMAVTYARRTLQNPEMRSNSQMLHLLSLLTSSAGDDKKVQQNFFSRNFFSFYYFFFSFFYFSSRVSLYMQVMCMLYIISYIPSRADAVKLN